MAADMSIHVFEGITEDDLKAFFADVCGSKYESEDGAEEQEQAAAISRIAETPQIWVGEVSWLKAVFYEDDESFIPAAVGAINELIGEDLPVIDDALIGKAKAAMQLENKTGYKIAKAAHIVKFLEAHKGKQAFTVTW